MLNLADMLTSKDGNPTTLSDRVVDIAKRYGVESAQFATAWKLAEKLISQVQKINAPQDVLIQLI